MNNNISSRTSPLRQSMMESLLVGVVVLVALSGFQHHAVVLSASTIQVRAGEDAILQCPLLDASNGSATITASATPDTFATPATLSWYRKAAGRGPELLLTFRSTNRFIVRYGNGVSPDKVSATADGSLLLRGSEWRDSAVYYCGISRGGGNQKDPTPWTLIET